MGINHRFLRNILKPLSHDLKYGEYRGYRFRHENIPQFFREFIDFCYDKRYWPVGGLFNHMNELRLFAITLIPTEIILSNYYAQTFLLVHNEELREAYMEMYVYTRHDRHDRSVFILEEHQILPPRPYYFYSDEDRYLWFEFLQAELRSAGHADFADEILEIEIEHYRELINWQLQLRAYLTQKLYEYGDNINLATSKELLTAEYIKLKNDPLLQTNFEMAIETLRDMNAANENLILPWIDREAIDSKQGIRSEVISVYPKPITWKTAMESIDDETMKEMKNSYERAIHCIRVLAVISERLYLERDLTAMAQLHSRLANNINVNYTPTGVFHQDFSVLKNTYGDGRYYFTVG